jgi:hypothetical protein
MITIATLRAAGLSAEQIVAVLETDENIRLTARREQNRINQQNHRKRVSADRADTADSADRDSALSSLLPSSESQQSKEEKEVKKERAKRDRGHVCPDDLRPSEVHFEAGAKQNISRPRVEACCEAMKAWSKANASRAVARKVDWSAALFGWISREAERTGKVNGHGIATAADDLIARAEAQERGFDTAGAIDVEFRRVEGS